MKVWASRWSHRALGYRNRQGRGTRRHGRHRPAPGGLAMSGVLFTEAPDDPAQMLVEFCSGMGEALVSGRNNPGRRHTRTRRLSIRPRGRAGGLPLALLVVGQRRRSCHASGRRRSRSRVTSIDRRTSSGRSTPTAGSGSCSPARSRQPRNARSRHASRNGTSSQAQAGHVHWSNANVNENFPRADLPAALLDRERRLLPLLPQPRPRLRHLADAG